MLNEIWVQQLLKYEATLAAPANDNKGVGRAWVDGALVVYDLDDIPVWLEPVLNARDADGCTTIAGVTLLRHPREGEYDDPQPMLVPFD